MKVSTTSNTQATYVWTINSIKHANQYQWIEFGGLVSAV